MKRMRLKSKFEYLPRDPHRLKQRLIRYRRLTTRLGLEGASPKKKKRLSGANTLLHHFERLEASRAQVERIEQGIYDFLNPASSAQSRVASLRGKRWWRHRGVEAVAAQSRRVSGCPDARVWLLGMSHPGKHLTDMKEKAIKKKKQGSGQPPHQTDPKPPPNVGGSGISKVTTPAPPKKPDMLCRWHRSGLGSGDLSLGNDPVKIASTSRLTSPTPWGPFGP